MKFLSKALLLDKEIKVNGVTHPVLGLSSFRTEPRGIGIGRASLKIFEDIAVKRGKACVFCFCFDDVKDFYANCGWHYCGRYKPSGKHMFSSIPLNDVEALEEW